MVSRRSWAIAALMALAGCQSYAPQPLDLRQYDQNWRSYLPDSGEVQALVQELIQDESELVFDPSDGFSLPEAEALALVLNPQLRIERESARVAEAGAAYAGLWDDPELSADVLRIVQSVSHPWTASAGVGFTIPLSGRLGVEKSLAAAEYEVALQQVIEREWATLTSLRDAWLEWSALQLQLDAATRLLDRIDDLVAIVQRLEQAGEISRMQSRALQVEQSARYAERLTIEHRAARLELQIKSLMGFAPNAPLLLHPDMTAAAIDAIDAAAMPEQLLESNPTLAVQQARYEAAEQTLHLEIRRQYPDITLGPMFEQDEGQTYIGLGGTIPLAIFNANRRGIAQATASREVARAEAQATLQRLANELAQAQLDWRFAQDLLNEIESNVVQLAEAQLADVHRFAELGELDIFLTLEAVVRSYETARQVIEARLAAAQAANRVRSLIGPQHCLIKRFQTDSTASGVNRP